MSSRITPAMREIANATRAREEREAQERIAREARERENARIAREAQEAREARNWGNVTFIKDVKKSDSGSVGAHYDKLIKRYLRVNGKTNLNGYELVLQGHNPTFPRWNYEDLNKPSKRRLKMMEKNFYTFDLIDYVEVQSNTAVKKYIRLKTGICSNGGNVDNEISYFKNVRNFLPPIFGYWSEPVATVNIAPLLPIENKSLFGGNHLVLNYQIKANITCKVQVRFQLKYIYECGGPQESQESLSCRKADIDIDEGLQEEPQEPQEPQDDHARAINTEAINTEAINTEATIIPVRRAFRSSSLRSTAKSIYPNEELRKFQDKLKISAKHETKASRSAAHLVNQESTDLRFHLTSNLTPSNLVTVDSDVLQKLSKLNG